MGPGTPELAAPRSPRVEIPASVVSGAAAVGKREIEIQPVEADLPAESGHLGWEVALPGAVRADDPVRGALVLEPGEGLAPPAVPARAVGRRPLGQPEKGNAEVHIDLPEAIVFDRGLDVEPCAPPSGSRSPPHDPRPPDPGSSPPAKGGLAIEAETDRAREQPHALRDDLAWEGAPGEVLPPPAAHDRSPERERCPGCRDPARPGHRPIGARGTGSESEGEGQQADHERRPNRRAAPVGGPKSDADRGWLTCRSRRERGRRRADRRSRAARCGWR